MKPIIAASLALFLSGCAGLGSSQTIYAYTLFDETTVGGPGYPIIIEGAENVGQTPVDIAQKLRFPPGPLSGSFRAVQGGPVPTNHAHLFIAQSGGRANATLTFLHGKTKTGLGKFSLPRQAFADPAAVGSISATLINDMHREARANFREDSELWPVD